MQTTSASQEPFFRYFGWIIFVFVVVSFGGKAVFDSENLPPITVLHHAHAVTMLLWFGLFALQPTLIHLGRVRTHRLLGRLSPLVVVAFIGMAVPISTVNWARTAEPLVATANGVHLILFVAFYLSGIAYRRRPMAHKRIMTYATILVIGPAAGRFPQIFGLSAYWAAPIMLAFQLAPLVHDFVTFRKVHPATAIGFGVAFAAIPLVMGLSGWPAWVDFLESVLG